MAELPQAVKKSDVAFLSPLINNSICKILTNAACYFYAKHRKMGISLKTSQKQALIKKTLKTRLTDDF